MSQAVQAPTPPILNPVQERMLAQLRKGDAPIIFDEAFVKELKEEAAEAFEQFRTRLGDAEFSITKYLLSSVHGCEGKFMVPEPFEWNISKAKGTVIHRAIQLMMNWKGEPSPRELVDEAMARLMDEPNGIGRWLEGLGPGDEADLRGNAVEHMTKFMETFPPLDVRSRPNTEWPARWPNDGPIMFSSRADLVVGVPKGRESTKLIVDFKTGRVSPAYRDDLRFYALVETLARDVPPRKLATIYLDSATPDVEEVSEGLLAAAMHRALDGLNKIIELKVEGRAPVLRPGPHCRWCPISADCPQSEADKSHDYD